MIEVSADENDADICDVANTLSVELLRKSRYQNSTINSLQKCK